jgi:hypothetical protein
LISYIITFAIGAIFGIVACDYILSKIEDEQEQLHAEEQFNVINIELHDGVYFAYSDSNLFLGQSHDIAELTYNLLGKKNKVNLKSEDPIVISELEQLSEKLESYRIAHESNQVH